MNNSGISFEGDTFEDLIKEFEEMEISEEKQKKALKVGGAIIYKNVVDNAPYLKGFTKKSIKNKIKKIDGDIACVISVNSWDAIFTEFGTSKSRKHIGWFTRAVEDVEEEAVKKIAEVVLS